MYATRAVLVTATKVLTGLAIGASDNARVASRTFRVRGENPALRMDKTRRSRLGSGGAFALAGSLAASMLLWFVVPVLAVTCPDNGNLTNPVRSPRHPGTTATNFTFSVTYQDNAGERADSIRVYFSDGTPDRRLNLSVRAT